MSPASRARCRRPPRILDVAESDAAARQRAQGKEQGRAEQRAEKCVLCLPREPGHHEAKSCQVEIALVRQQPRPEVDDRHDEQEHAKQATPDEFEMVQVSHGQAKKHQDEQQHDDDARP